VQLGDLLGDGNNAPGAENLRNLIDRQGDSVAALIQRKGVAELAVLPEKRTAGGGLWRKKPSVKETVRRQSARADGGYDGAGAGHGDDRNAAAPALPHETESGIAESRRARVADEGDRLSRGEQKRQPLGGLTLVVLVVGDQVATQAEAVKQHARRAGVFAGHQIGRTEYGPGAFRQVGKVSDRRCDDVKLAGLGNERRAQCVALFIPSMPGYVYAQKGDDLYVNLFVNSTANIELNGKKVTLEQKTDYPWNGKVEFTLKPEKAGKFNLMIRIPGWAQNQVVPTDLYRFSKNTTAQATLSVNGIAIKYILKNGYAMVEGNWKSGDKVTLDLPMPVREVIANEKVKADIGRVALQRGPLVYCAEWPDNKDGHVLNLLLKPGTSFTTEFRPQLLNGVTVIKGEASSFKRSKEDKILKSNGELVAIPYYAWANRGAGEMSVWLPNQQSAAKPLPAPTIAYNSKISASTKSKALMAVNDQLEPENSNDQNVIYYHWWPKKNTLEWIQYDFAKAEKISSSKVYWFDDGPWGGCRVPASWRLLYKDTNGGWVPVKNTTNYSVEKDKNNEVRFEPVETTALKMEIQLPVENASGIYEWSVK